MSSCFQLPLASGERGGWRAAAAAVGRLACSALFWLNCHREECLWSGLRGILVCEIITFSLPLIR